MSSSDEAFGLLGAYAVGAVDDDERARVEALLDRSASARAELARHEHALAGLTDAEATTTPPAGAWDRLRVALRDDEGAGAGAALPPPATLPPLRLPPRPPAPAPPAPSTNVVPLRAARRFRVVLASAAALVAAALGTGLVVGRQRSAGTLERAAAEALAADDSVTGDVVNAAGTVRLRAVVDRNGHGYLYARDLPALPEGRTYQLWSLDGASPVSLGLLGNRPGLVTFPTGGQVRALAISDERSPGATAPTAPIAQGTLT